jgi:hypothetical protein
MRADGGRSTGIVILASAVALAAGAASCGGRNLSSPGLGGMGGNGGSGGVGGTAGGIPLAMFASDYMIAYCTPLVACQVFADLSTCRAEVSFEQDRRILTALGEVGREPQ